VGEDEQHAHEDDQVGVEARWAEQLPERRVGNGVVDAVEERAESQDNETGSHVATLHPFCA
jgi:hypothetical protein